MSLPPPGIYGNTGINPNPQTPFSTYHPTQEVLPSQMQPHEILRAAIRQVLAK